MRGLHDCTIVGSDGSLHQGEQQWVDFSSRRRGSKPRQEGVRALDATEALGATGTPDATDAPGATEANGASEATPPKRRRPALLLIDFQRTFLDGNWAQEHGLESGEVQPIVEAAERTSILLQGLRDAQEQRKDLLALTGTLPRGMAPLKPVPVMVTRCYLEEGEGSELAPQLLNALGEGEALPWVYKPSDNVMDLTADGELMAEWIEAQMHPTFGKGVNTLVIGGCTTTSCVRVSSQAIQAAFGPLGLQVVVDLSLCGARLKNYSVENAQSDPELISVYGEEVVEGRCAVDLAVLQMEQAGVKVVYDFDFEGL